jgi:hypothetical protein
LLLLLLEPRMSPLLSQRLVALHCQKYQLAGQTEWFGCQTPALLLLLVLVLMLVHCLERCCSHWLLLPLVAHFVSPRKFQRQTNQTSHLLLPHH